MRILLEVRESIVWILKLFSERHRPGLLPLLLALLGTTWAGVQPLQLQEQRVPMPEGKGATE